MRPKFLTILLVGLMLVASCGKKEEPAPAPPPANPNPVAAPTGPGGCPPLPAGGVPLRSDNQPYTASLTSVESGSSANSISLQLVSMNANAGDPIVNVAGTGTVTLPDLDSLLGGHAPVQSFCVSSVNPVGNTLSPGVLRRDSSIAMLLTGFVQVPTVTPFQGYPGNYPGYPNNSQQQQTATTRVEVSIGNYRGCFAALQNGRFSPGSCVIVSIGEGQFARQLRYQADVMGGGGGYGGGGYGGGGYSPYGSGLPY